MIEVGTLVHWTICSLRKRTVSMQRREGKVVAIEGDVAQVKVGRRIVSVELSRLRLTGEQSQIAEFIEGVREAHSFEDVIRKSMEGSDARTPDSQ